ncbi:MULTISPECIES: YbjN domain-containing protein [Croceimicrobium]|uniref:YbjN domain-containing protein n=1 Tax=Croceimicrobium hydrocarbonivorans TaxID=2761580 RepID=A0A7H0VHM1_9FLAO|nr:YbjN domain-containing protein [Croceimicrobium hydrocarbonivorans]QNR25219.1 YbjN domain-containing protein [Croceimicrobium hydrocarbonivorans]
MTHHFDRVKNYLIDLDYNITYENAEEEVFVVEYPDAGIYNLVIAVADPILIMEQFLFELKEGKPEVFRKLLEKNRDIVHGAFALDETGTRVVFRDTLQLENIDLNEIEGSVNSLELLLSEYSDELIEFSKN